MVVLVEVPQVLQVGVFLMFGQEAVKVGIVGVDMVGGKLAGAKALLPADVLHVDLGGLREIISQFLGIVHGVGGGPVGKGDEALGAVLLRFIGGHHLPGVGQENFEVTGVLRVKILAVQLRLLGKGFVRIADQGAIPLHPQDVPAHPGGDVPAVGAGKHRFLPALLIPAVNRVHRLFAVAEEGFVEFLVQNAAGGVEQVVVHPHAVEQIERLRVVPIEFVKRLVEVRPCQGIGADHVGAQRLDLSKPAEILLLGDRQLRSVVPRLAQSQVNALQLEFSIAGTLVQVQRLSLRLGKILRRVPEAGQIEHARAEIEPVQQKQQDHAGDCDDKELLHVPPSSVMLLNFLFMEAWQRMYSRSRLLSMCFSRWAMVSFICRTASSWLRALRSSGIRKS